MAARTAADAALPDRATTKPANSPYVVEQAVRFEAAVPPGPPRTPPASSHPPPAPSRVVIPRLDVDAPAIGIDAPGGVLVPPDDPQVLGWWQAGARPGAARGSALITGHTVSTGGGAFDDLESLAPGDRVQVAGAAGVLDYRVDRVAIFRKARLAKNAARVFDQSVPGRLVLITCEDWDGSTYLSNVVVFARPTA